ncbi:MAG TPA: selenium-binding protein SBP56-related protein [Candidatus Aquilonibacter sp.]|nr:selenium-binding protein SBP56-related protein [Candidatus Aquilonibacter sp.]
MSLKPDPSFYPSPGLAMQAAPERIAYVTLLNVGKNGKRDAMGVINVDPQSSAYGRFVGQVDFPNDDNELHHFGWNACSACLCPQAPHPHMERRYLVVPGIGSSRIHILDTKPDPNHPKIVKVIEPAEFIKKTGYTSPHTIHCGPDGIYGSALGSASGDGPGGIFLMDANTFELKGQWEKEHGPQNLAYDFWWHLGHDTMITSEWGTPNMVKNGLIPELRLGGKYGHKLHIWDLDKRRHLQEIDLGAEQQMVLELRPSHDPKKTFGFVGVVISLKDLSSSIWMWHREDGGKNSKWAVRKVIEIPAEPADPESLPPLLKGFRRCRHWYPTSTSPSTTAFSMSRAGGLESFSSMMSLIPPIRKRPAQSMLVASCAGPLTRKSPGKHSMAVRRWLRSAATASASISPTLSTPRGTSSFIPMV